MNVINIGIGELVVNRAPFILETRGLGSCVGVTFYDKKNKIGALAHIMLANVSCKSEDLDDGNGRFRYAEYALPYMLNKMLAMGGNKDDIVAKIVGGASMFKRKSGNLNVGEKNVFAVKKFLKENSIKLEAEEVGGDIGRTIIFNLNDGSILMKIYGKVKQEIEL